MYINVMHRAVYYLTFSFVLTTITMSFISNIFRTHNFNKEWFRSTKYDSILLKDVPLREFPEFLRSNCGANGWYRYVG